MTARQGDDGPQTRRPPNFDAKTARQIARAYRAARLQRMASGILRRLILLELLLLAWLWLERQP